MGFCNAQRGGATTIRRETTQVVPNILWAFAKLKATNGAIELRPDSLVENGNLSLLQAQFGLVQSCGSAIIGID